MKIIYFDFFGVLSSPAYWAVIQKLLPKDQHDVFHNKLEVLDLGVLSESDFVVQIAIEAGTTEELVWREVVAEPKLNEELLLYISEKLSGIYKIGLMTNAPRSLIERVLDDKLQIFSPILISSDLGVVKPDQVFFHQAIEQAKCGVDEILFIDDTEKNVLAARQEGMNSLLYADNSTLFRQLEDLQVNSPS